MTMQLTTVQVWVLDQDEALEFWTRKVGFEVREDVTVAELGNFRWLTVAPKGGETAIVLMKIPPAPVFTEETRGQIESLLAKGASGGLFFVVEDCQAAYEELKARGVEFTSEPMQLPYGIDCGFRDPFGNQFRLTQRMPLPA